MVLFSVIVPCYNAEQYIEETIESIYQQKIDDLEIIAIDDGSTDNTAQIITSKFPAVHLVRTENRGPSRARNLGTSISSGAYIQYLDADDLLGRDKLKIQLEQLRSSGADVAYGNWQKLVKSDRGTYILGEVVNRQMTNPVIDLFTGFWCPPADYLFRRSIVDAVGEWNERLPVIQDARFAHDCALHGARFVYCDGMMAYYRVHTSGSVSTRSRIMFLRDCYTNASDIEEIWIATGDIDSERREALLMAYEHVARASFEVDRVLFEQAYVALKRLKPNYLPSHPVSLRLVSKLFGYPNGETIALWYRRMKKRLHR